VFGSKLATCQHWFKNNALSDRFSALSVLSFEEKRHAHCENKIEVLKEGFHQPTTNFSF